MATKKQDLITELLELVDEEFEGYCDSHEDLEEFVSDTLEGLMDDYDVDIEYETVLSEVLKNVEVRPDMDSICMECGDPDCFGCND